LEPEFVEMLNKDRAPSYPGTLYIKKT